MQEAPQTAPVAPTNPWLELAVTILAPSLVLMQFSGDTNLSAKGALLAALAFPLGWGMWQAYRGNGFGLMAGIGLVSTLLTGGLGLLQLDAFWLAVKEAAVSGVMGLVIAASAWTRTPLIRWLVFNRTLFDVDKVEAALKARGTGAQFDTRLRQATLMLAGTFFFSALMNYVLARWLVTSPAGTEAFNAELGRLTLLSWPVIMLPSLAMMVALMAWLGRCSKTLAGLDLLQMMHAPKP